MDFRFVRGSGTLLFAVLLSLLVPTALHAQQRIVELEFTPTSRAQIAIWIETADGEFLQTLRLTEATALRGIGNRPGAMQMNSGFHWPYGRREGVLPVWAHRRQSAQEPFRRVIFQDRASEGFASRTSNDASPDSYFCLSFNQSTTTRDALDAVTCASQFNSDKGRYLTDSDVSNGYAEPYELENGEETMMRAMDTGALYPPRRDLPELLGMDHEDVLRFADDAAVAMPEIDAVTMATLPGAETRTFRFNVPEDWADGDYSIFVEVNVEGDYNTSYGPERYPTPTLGTGTWDHWARSYGYPYRGQPSVVYEIPVQISRSGDDVRVNAPIGYGSTHGEDGEIRPLDETISDDPGGSPGSGADRLLADNGGARIRVTVPATNVCAGDDPPPQCFTSCGPEAPCDEGFLCDPGSRECLGRCDVELTPGIPTGMTLELDEEKSWEFAHVGFIAPELDRPLSAYEVRVATTPFEPGMNFNTWGTEAKAASLEDVAVVVPTGAAPGERIEFEIGHLQPQTEYYVGVRAVDDCNASSGVSVAQVVTTEIIFTTVSPCFVATASYGTPMADEIRALRRFRDRHLLSNAPGRAFVDAYYEYGPTLAEWVGASDERRAATRTVLQPLVSLANWLGGDS